jgi:hypothetical protein
VTFLLYFGIYWLSRENWARPARLRLLRISVIILAVCAGLDVLLRLATGYHPIATFRHAFANQVKINWRPYYPFPLWDPYDFLLGTGILAFPILVLHVHRLFRQQRPFRGWDPQRDSAALTLIGLAGIFTIDASGLLRGETTRVWLFLQPLLVVPVAMELCSFPWKWRVWILTLQWWILACLKAKMSFVNP